MARGDETVRVQVWDLPTRLFHWALVAAVAFSWYSAENGMTEWHERSGIAILAMLAFRLIWGFVGGQWSRFADFRSAERRVGEALGSTCRFRWAPYHYKQNSYESDHSNRVKQH